LVSQHPEAVILSCLDSRVLVEDIFDARIGDLFVARVAGNIVDEDILGSLEYGCAEAGAKLVVILGHESCGAVKAAIEDVHLGNITAMLAKIKPALIKSKDFTGEKNSENEAYVEYVVKNNVQNTIAMVRSKSPVLKTMEVKGEIKIVGAYYDLKTGQVKFL
jgi:carbonic anhydrase